MADVEQAVETARARAGHGWHATIGAMSTPPDLRMPGPAGPAPEVTGRVEIKVHRGERFTLDHLRALVAAADAGHLAGSAAVTANVKVSGRLGGLAVAGAKAPAPAANPALTDGR